MAKLIVIVPVVGRARPRSCSVVDVVCSEVLVVGGDLVAEIEDEVRRLEEVVVLSSSFASTPFPTPALLLSALLVGFMAFIRPLHAGQVEQDKSS